MKKEMLINVLQPEECRIAILEDGLLEELYVERTSQESYVGNIYKGRIVNIEPSIQAAFVDFGVGRNGFLHVSDVEPAYYRHLEDQRRSEHGQRRDGGGRPGQRRPDPFADDLDFDEPPRRRPMEDPEPGPGMDAERLFPATGQPEGAAPASDDRARPEATDETAAGEERRGRGNRGRSRRRDRGGESRRRPGPERDRAPASPPPAPLPAAEESAPQEPPRAAEDPPRPRPQVMDSAERRTDEHTPHGDSVEPPAVVPDGDIFFPRSVEPERPAEPERRVAPAAVHFAPPPVAEPAVEERRPAPRELAEEPAPEWEEPEAEPEQPFEEDADSEEFADENLPDIDDIDDFEIPYEEPRRRPRRDDRRGGGDRRGRDDRRGRPRGRMFGRPGAGRPKPLIQDIFKRGQEVLVQVIKEGIGTKGPTLSTYISIAGRYLVLMPGLNRIGVSRKITDEESRRRLREILSELQPPKGLGFIIRTAGIDRNKKELQRDLAYLSRLWQVVVRRIRKLKSPAEIYQESDMITRTIRDTFTGDIDTIWVDEPTAYEHAKEFLQIVMPRYASRIKLYDGREPMFHKYGIEEEIARIQRRHVPLPNGGSIVIDQTEALVAIDVNSGNFRADNNAEETAYQINLLAAKEIARQLRLRDLGGVIVNDFIDMRDEKHRRGVERAMRDAVKRDRARTKLLRISAFGIIEMTRQRIRPSLKRSVYQDCPHCLSTGQVKTCESMSIDVMRLLQLAAHRTSIQRIQVRVHHEVAHYLLNKKRKEISRLEEAGDNQVLVTALHDVSPETLEFMCYENNNSEVKFLPFESGPRDRGPGMREASTGYSGRG